MGRVPERLVEVWAAPGAANVGSSGSGWVVGERGVLTAWHVVQEFEEFQEFEESAVLQARLGTAQGTEDWHDCTVRWSNPRLDVALLEVIDPRWQAPECPCELADVGDQSLACDVIGFPESEARPEGDRDTGHARGHLLTAGGARSRRVPFDVDSTSPESPELWQGMSGALVRDLSGRLVAVITSAHGDRERRRLLATAIADITDKEGFPEAFREVGQNPQLAEALGRPVATHPATTTPEALPNGFAAWPSPDDLFKGRTDKLELGRRRFRHSTVLPVHGPRYAGKKAFVHQLLATRRLEDSAPKGKPWLLLEITVTNASAESPVLEALASALDVHLQDGILNTEVDDGDPRPEMIIDCLREHARGRTLLMVINCARLGYDPRQIHSELDRLLAHPYFRYTANIIISRVSLGDVHGDYQLKPQVDIRLAELQHNEAADLLTTLMAQEGVTVDGDDVMSRIQDHRLRLPGVLSQCAKSYLNRDDIGGAVPDPASLATALLEGSAPSVARTLHELDCRLTPAPDSAADAPEPLAILTVWALADQMPLPQHVLESSSVGISGLLLSRLQDARILSRTESAHLALGRASEQALRSLLIAALTRGEDRHDDAPPVINPEYLGRLFPAELDPQELDRRLCAAAGPLMLTAGRSLDADDENADRAFRYRLRSVLGWIEDDGRKKLPKLHETIRPLVLGPAGDAPYLPTSRDELGQSPTAPFASEPLPDASAVEEAVPPLIALYRLYHAVASVTLAARAEGAAAEAGAGFVTAAEEFAWALDYCDPDHVPHSLLRSVDASLALTGKRLGLRVRLLDVRRAAVDVVLAGARRTGTGQASRITLAVSWLLNTADTLIDADRRDDAQGLVRKAEELVANDLPQDGMPRSLHTRLQLNSRIARVRSRTFDDSAESRRELVNVVNSAVSGLKLAHEQGEPLTLWSTRLFESAILLLQQSSTDEELLETRSLVLGTLEHCWGSSRSWPLNICIWAARFLRKLHARCDDPALKQRGAKEAVELLGHLPEATLLPTATPEGAPSPDDQNAAKVLSSLAQAYGFLAHALRENQRIGQARARLEKAEEYAHAAVALAPSAFLYQVWLRQVLDIRRFTPRTGTVGGEAETQRRACIKAVRRWLADSEARSHAHALLDLNCLESDWSEQGSLRGAAQQPGEDFLRLPAGEQRRRIEPLYRERQQKLNAHRYRYGPSIELCALETRLEREYRRWTGIIDFKQARKDQKNGIGPGPQTKAPQVDNTPIFTIFSQATDLWPGEARLIAAEAAFHRYVWNCDEAITLYEILVRIAPNGEIRRFARLSAAEALLADVEHTSPDRRQDWHSQLYRAQEHLNAIPRYTGRVGMAVILRERTAIRIGQPVNWEPINSAFETIVGDDYAGAVGRFLDRRRHGQESSPHRVGDQAHIIHRGPAESPEQQKLRDLFDKPAADRVVPEGTPATADAYVHDEDDEDLEQGNSEFLGELLLTDFTSVPLLNGLGKLYLDRASELLSKHQAFQGVDPEPGSSVAMEATDHARHAYDCFDACRVLQEAHGNESIVTKFERGRAITLAAKCLHSANPFPFPWLDEARPLIKQANSLLATARDNSVGGFNAVCARWLWENRDVQTRLGLMTPRPS
ncbi:serine protease [Streptomyces sp. B21-101]|uniref:serine protease n=1 Tax=Streptomyces sp. B21-101 TaxID=3039415 RepID=UPI002FF32741